MDYDSLPSDLRELADDEAARKDYARLWSLLQSATPASSKASASGASYDVDAAWKDLSDRLDLDAESAPADRPRRDQSREARGPKSGAVPQGVGTRRATWLGATAAVLLLLAVAGGMWWSQPVVVSTAAGEQETVALPDGSTVDLNGASRIAFARGFDRVPFVSASERSVRLEGEAYFQVRATDRPFRVRTDNAVVEVLGTAFNVRARQTDGAPVTDVVLASGQVRVSGAAASASDGSASERSVVTLGAPGTRSRVTGTRQAPSTPEKVDVKYAAAWRTGGFSAQNAPLSTILQDLERQFGADLRLTGRIDSTRTLTLHYGQSVRLDDVLRDLCVIQGLTYRKTSDGYVLEPEDP